MRRHIFLHIWWLALFFGLLGACALTATTPDPLRVRTATWIGYAPLYAVAEHNLAAPTTLNISTAELAQDNYRAFAERRVDVLATTLHSALQFRAQGTDTAIILVTDFSNGADGIIARPGIDQVADLAGQRVGVESGSIGHFVLLRALTQAGLSEEDVEIVHIGVTEGIEAIESNMVDAAVVWDPVLSAYGRAPIFTTADIPYEIVDVLVVHPETLEQRSDDLINLVRGWDSAVQQWRAASPEITATMTDAMNVDAADLRQQFMRIELVDLELNRRLFELGGPDSIQPTYNDLVAFLQTTNQIQTAPPAEDLLHDQIVYAALREHGTEQ